MNNLIASRFALLTRRLFAVLALGIAWTGATHASTLQVGYTCRVLTISSSTDLCDPIFLTNNASASGGFSPGYLPNSGLSSSGNFSSIKPPSPTDPGYEYVSGTSGASVRANYGDLGISLQSTAVGTFNQGGFYDFRSWGVVSFLDSITIHSPPGTSKLTIQGFFDVVDISQIVSSNQVGFSGSASNSLTLEVITSSGSYSARTPTPGYAGPILSVGKNPFSFDIDVVDGMLLSLGGRLTGETTAAVGSSTGTQSGLALVDALSLSAYSSIGAFNSLHVFISSLSPQLSFTSLSGHNYLQQVSQQVPEPSTLYLVVLGGIAMLWRKGLTRGGRGGVLRAGGR